MITGLLEQRPLPVVLQQLYTLRFTGELALNTRAGLIQIYLREGYPVYVNLAESADLLGRIMVEMRVMNEAAMRRALATPPEPGQRFGEVALSLGLCDENQLKQALRTQVRRKLHRLFAMTEGGYAAIPGEHQRGIQNGESMRVHPFRVIYHGVRSYSPERLQALLQPLSGQALRLSPQVSIDVASRFGFAAQETYVLELLRRGFWSLPELLEIAALEAALTQAVIYALLCTEHLELGPAGSQPQAREHILDLPPPKAEPVADVPPPPAQTARAAPPPRPAPPRAAKPAKPPGSAEPPVLELDPRLLQTEPPRPAPPPWAAKPAKPSMDSPILGLELESRPSDKGGAPSAPPQETPVPPGVQAQAQADRPPAPQEPRVQEGLGPAPRPPGAAAGAGASQTSLPAVSRPQAAAPARPAHRPVSFEEMALLRAEIENKAKVIEDESLFAVLGLGQDADAAAAKAAFLRLAKKYHPDRVVAMGLQALQAQAEKIFRRLNEAHSVLCDPEKREEYLAELKLKESSGDKLAREKELAVKAVNAELAFSRGTVFLRKRDYAAAAREFEEALRLNPDEGEHLGYASWARFCAGKIPAPEATREMVKAIRMAPKCGRLHYFLGVLYKQEGNEDKAYQSFKKGHELDNRLDEAMSEIRLIEARRGKKSSGAKTASADSTRGKSSESHKGDKKRSFLDMLRQPIGKK